MSCYDPSNLSRLPHCDIDATLAAVAPFKSEIDAYEKIIASLSALPETIAFAKLLSRGHNNCTHEEFCKFYSPVYKKAGEMIPTPFKIVSGWITSKSSCHHCGKVFINEKRDQDTAIRHAIAEAVWRFCEVQN